MKKKIILLAILAGLAISFGAMASEYNPPSAPPPDGNIATPINVGATSQSKLGGLTLNTGGATYGLLIPYGKVGVGTLTPGGIFEVFGGVTGVTPASLFKVSDTGTVGIGVANPASRLSIAGGVQISDDPTACSSTKAGTIRWHSAVAEICNGTAWVTMGTGGDGGTITNGTVMGYCHVLHWCQTGAPQGMVCTNNCEFAKEPAWCNNQIPSKCGCPTGYRMTEQFHTPTAGVNVSNYDYSIFTCNRDTSVPVGPSGTCNASGACDARPGGATCDTYSVNASPSSATTCADYKVTSTCSGGAWNPTPASYYNCNGYVGCRDINAANYDPNANVIDNSTCLYLCTNPAATNYNQTSHNNPPCSFPYYGCKDPDAVNYNPSATDDDGTCSYDGCMDSIACNYEPKARTELPGQCNYDCDAE